MDENQKEQTKKKTVAFLKHLGETFAVKAAASAGVTVGVMVTLRIVLPKSAAYQATTFTTASK